MWFKLHHEPRIWDLESWSRGSCGEEKIGFSITFSPFYRYKKSDKFRERERRSYTYLQKRGERDGRCGNGGFWLFFWCEWLTTDSSFWEDDMKAERVAFPLPLFAGFKIGFRPNWIGYFFFVLRLSALGPWVQPDFFQLYFAQLKNRPSKTQNVKIKK